MISLDDDWHYFAATQIIDAVMPRLLLLCLVSAPRYALFSVICRPDADIGAALSGLLLMRIYFRDAAAAARPAFISAHKPLIDTPIVITCH